MPRQTEAVAIRSRCVVAALAVLALLAPLAGAQVAPPVRLTAASAQADALPGGTASFEVTANNTGPLPLAFRFETLASPPNWTVTFNPPNLTLRSGATAKSTFVVYVPGDAAPGTVAALRFVARDDLQNAVSDALNLTVTVQAPPAPPAPSVPRLSMSIAAASGEAGTSIESILTLLSGDAEPLDVSLAISQGAWNPRFQDGITAYTVHPGFPKEVRVRADVPADAPAGTRHHFVITAVTKGHAFQVPWNVTALASTRAAATDPAPAPDAPGGAAAATTTPTPTGAAAPPATRAVTLAASVEELDVEPGATREATLLLRNTGTAALALDLRYQPPAADWAVRLDAARVDLPAGATRTVGIHVTAPDGVPAGGTATIDFQAIEGDLVAKAALRLRIVEGALRPRDETTAAALAPAPATDDNTGGLPTAAWLAVGVGTVGAAALAIGNRPLREKLLWASVGLYTRLAQPDILGHPERDRLYKIVEAQPGIHFHALQRDLGWNTGTLTYHLRVLERHQFVVSRRDGPYRRFFKVGAAPRKELFSADAPQGLRADVLEAIRNRHGISQSDLALALGANKQTVNYHVKTLERQGLIRVERRGRETFLYPHHAGVGPSGPVGDVRG